MAFGPKLAFIKAGDALVADLIMQNFQAVVDFVRAIPANNLLQSKQTICFQGDVGAVAAAATAYSGYKKVNVGSAPTQIEYTAEVQMVGLVAALASMTVSWEKCTPASPQGPKFADVWTVLAGSIIVFDGTNTLPGLDDVLGDPTAKPPYRYCQTGTLANLPAIADGDWVRCKFVAVGATGAITQGTSQLILKTQIRG